VVIQKREIRKETVPVTHPSKNARKAHAFGVPRLGSIQRAQQSGESAIHGINESPLRSHGGKQPPSKTPEASARSHGSHGLPKE
jgi:hypothetical protein